MNKFELFMEEEFKNTKNVSQYPNIQPFRDLTNVTKENVAEEKIKRFKKSNGQLILLQSYYIEDQNWDRKKINAIAEISNLTQEKVYKWLWDKKKKSIVTLEDKKEPRCDLIFIDGLIHDKNVKHMSLKGDLQISYHIRNEVNLLFQNVVKINR